MSLPIPALHDTPGGKELRVHGQPFLIRGAELQNSSMSSARFMEPIWPKLAAANINTIFGCVAWETIEPAEGHFDFAELDLVIEGARAHDLRLILLWFGSFKNGLSTYAPGWVKTDMKRFPRAKLRKAGGRLQVADALSIFETEAKESDARAFGQLMQHVKEVDQGHSTVVMVQVENEVGILGDSRDASPAANAHFESPVPQKLIDVLHAEWDLLHDSFKENLVTFQARSLPERNTSWESVFGQGPRTDEIFMAYHYALYLEKVASAGKNAYPIPLYTNVWQNYAGADSDNDFPVVVGGGGDPGDYPSGGGVVNVLDIWRTFAPALDFIAPDVYLTDYAASCAKYRHRNQPLLIPEQRRDEYGARRIWIAYGSYQCLGTAPFGIDTVEVDENPFKKHYGLLAEVSFHVLAAQRNPGSSIGFCFDEPTPNNQRQSVIHAVFGSWGLQIERSFVFGKQGPGFGMIIHLGGARFLLIGEGFQVRFSSTNPQAVFTGLLRFVEMEMVNQTSGEMRAGRILGGDETRSGAAAVMPATSPDYGDFPISITIPARTRIATCEAYALIDEGI